MAQATRAQPTVVAASALGAVSRTVANTGPRSSGLQDLLLHIASPVFALDVLAFASRPKQKLLERNAYKRLDSPLPGI